MLQDVLTTESEEIMKVLLDELALVDRGESAQPLIAHSGRTRFDPVSIQQVLGV